MRSWPFLFGVSTCGWLWIESIDFQFIHYVYSFHKIHDTAMPLAYLQKGSIIQHITAMTSTSEAHMSHDPPFNPLVHQRWKIPHVPYNGNVGAISHFQTHPYIIVHHHISSYLIYHHMSSYIIIYQRMSSYIIIYHHISYCWFYVQLNSNHVALISHQKSPKKRKNK